ncbi:hypothetical protein BC567DRAFT_222937 [Phyllosticta citribraziliensis]
MSIVMYLVELTGPLAVSLQSALASTASSFGAINWLFDQATVRVVGPQKLERNPSPMQPRKWYEFAPPWDVAARVAEAQALRAFQIPHAL